MLDATQARALVNKHVEAKPEITKGQIEEAIKARAAAGFRFIGSGDCGHLRLSTEAKRELDDAGFAMEFHGPTNWTIRW